MTGQKTDEATNPIHAQDQSNQLTSEFKAFKTMADLLRASGEEETVLSDEQNKNAQRNKFIYKKERTSTEQTTIVKHFNDESYNGPALNDFMERLNIIFEAAQKMIEDSKDDPSVKNEKMTILNRYKEIANKSLKNDCDIKPVSFKELFSNLNAHEKRILEQIKTATHLIGEFINNSLPLLKENNQSLAVTKKQLMQTESEITATKGRPNFINYYPSTTPEIERVSIQRVVGDAIPSTKRDAAKLPNFVECSVGYKENEQYHPQFHGYRHSSYTPIKMTNKEERALATRATVKEMLTELARQKINSLNPHPKTIKINLSSLALLSPIWMDKKVLPKGESEVDQLTECYDALMSFNKTATKLTVDGTSITVTPTITVLNAASNGHGVIIHNKLNNGLMYREERINAQGINQFAFKTLHYLLNDKTSNTDSASNSAFQLLTELQTKIVNLKNQDKSPAEIKELILDLEVKYYNKFKELFNNNRETFLKELKNAAARKNANNETHQKDNDRDVANLAFQAIAMQIDHIIEPPQYGVRYLLACQKMGDFVDFYCKSGEDRTGRMQNLIEELCEHKRSYGDYPEYTNKKIIIKDADIQLRVAQHASEFSVSRDINNENAHGARGLQIGSDLKLNTNLPNDSGKALAKMAKEVYGVSSSLTSKNYIAQTLNKISDDYQQIKKERKELSVSDKMDILTLSKLQQKINSNIRSLHKQLDTFNTPPFKDLFILNKKWAPNLSRITEKVNLHIVEIDNELKEYQRLLNQVTVAAGTKHYLYLGSGISIEPITAQDKQNVTNTPDFSAKTILTARKDNSDINSLLKSADNEQKDDLYYRYTTNYAENNYNTITIFDLSIEQTQKNASHFKPNIKLQMIQPPTCCGLEDKDISLIPQEPSCNSKIHSYMSMALTILTAKEGIPTPEWPIIIENGTAEQREFLWTMLVILGEKKFGFKPDALKVSSGDFYPEKIMTKGYFSTSFAKESIYHQLTHNQNAMLEINRHLKNADETLSAMKKGNVSDFKDKMEQGRNEIPSPPTSIVNLKQ